MFGALSLSVLASVFLSWTTLTVKDTTDEYRCASREVLLKQVDAQLTNGVSDATPVDEAYSVAFSNPPSPGTSAQPTPNSFDATAAVKPRLWRAEIVGRNGTRVLEDVSVTCEALSQAVAVSLTLLLRSVASTPPSPVVGPSSAASASLGLGLASPWISPVSPFLTLGGDVFVGQRWWLGAGAIAFLPSTRSAPPGEVRALAFGGAVRAGIRFQATPSIALRPGAAFSLGAAIGSGTGYAANRQVTEFWLAANLELTATWYVAARLGFFARAAMLLSLRRPAFDVSGVGVILQTPLATGLFEVGPTLRW